MYRVLIVEDDPQVAQIHSRYLERSGFSVVGVAADADQAMDMLRQQPVHLVLLDIYLPGGSGFQVLRSLRAGEQAVEVIVVSAAKDSTQIREAFRMGCLDYIIKPFTYDRLHAALVKYQKKAELLSKDFLAQDDIDALVAQQMCSEQPELPKGIDRNTLQRVCQCVLELSGPFGVQNVAEHVQISRVSAKKYLDFLCDQKVLGQTYVYGNKGRPAHLYQTTPADAAAIRQQMERWI